MSRFRIDIIKNKLKSYFKNNKFIAILRSLRGFYRSAKYYRKYFEILRGTNSVADIQVISIEFCSICNLRCRYCFLEKEERSNFLDLRIYENLLKEICGNKKYNLKVMEWPISGCFFLHPQYKEIIKITKQYKDQYSNFSPWIILNDNMMLLDKDNVNYILESKVINQIICSIDGVDKDTFEQMRPSASFEKVTQNTLQLIRQSREMESRIVIQINNGNDATCKNRKLDLRLNEIFKLADYVTSWEPVDWNESFHTDKPGYNPAKHFCSFVFDSATLSSSGAIIKCCMDLHEATKYGDFTKDSLEAIWLSDSRKSFLRLMYQGNRHLIPGCGRCSINYVSQNKYPR